MSNRSARRVRILPAPGAAAFLALLAVLVASSAAADFSFTETMTFSWHGNNMDGREYNDDYFDIKNRLNIQFTEKMIETLLRLDTMTMFDYDGKTPKAPAGREYTDDYRLERITGILKPAPRLKVTLGDTYAQLGNGILLSLRKIDELGMETTLRGVKIDYEPSIVSLSLMGGVTNTNNVDQQDNYFYEDPMDRIAAAQVAVRPHPRMKIQAQGLFLNWTEVKTGETLSPMAYGGGLLLWGNLWPGRITAEAESDVLWREKVAFVDGPDPGWGTEPFRGQAVYLKMHGIFGRLSLLLEGKYYENFLVTGSEFTDDNPITYNQPPTAERYDQEVNSNLSVYGGRLKADVKVLEDFIVYANLSAGDYVPLTEFAEGNGENRKAWYIHAYGGMKMFFNSGLSELSVSGGWRREMEPRFVPGQEEPEGWTRHMHIYHVEAKAVFYIAEGWSVRYSILHETWGKKLATEYHPWSRGTQILGVDLAGVMSLNAAFEYDTEFLKMPFDRNLYGWWEARVYPMQNLIVGVKAGMERGGLKCVSGICKRVPPFTGLLLSVIYRH
jgi:hypothetical protein